MKHRKAPANKKRSLKVTTLIGWIIVAAIVFGAYQCSSQRTYVSDCERAVKRAAEVSAYEDRIEGLDPAIRVCTSLSQLRGFVRKYPSALDGVDVSVFVGNRCRYNQQLKPTPLCQEVQD